MKNKCLALLMTLVLMLCMMPATVLAGGGTDSPVTVTKATFTTDPKIKGVCEIWFEIDETAEGNVLVDVGAAIIDLLSENVGFIMPSNQFKVKMHIKNSSPNAWVYQNNGMNLKTVDAEDAGLTGFIGYDGYNIDLSRIAAVDCEHPALTELFGTKKPTADQMLSLFDLLSAKGYTGDDALSRYFVDYYRNVKSDTSLENWADLLSKYRDSLINTLAKTNYSPFFRVNEAWLDSAKTSSMANYIYKVGQYSNNDWQIQFKWPDKNLATFTYNLFYQDLLTVSFGDKEIGIHDENRDIGVGDYLNKNEEPYTGANAYLATIGDNGQLASDAEGEFELALTLEGPGTGNMYMGYEFTNIFNLTLQFIPATTDIVVSKEWDDANDKDGSRPDSVTVQLYANGDKSGEPVTLDSAGDWKHTFNVPVYSRGEEITYTVEEAAVNGYTATVTGNAADGFVITNSHEPENIVDVPIDVPETGDPSHMMLWLALACLSLCGMAVVLQHTRKEN